MENNLYKLALSHYQKGEYENAFNLLKTTDMEGSVSNKEKALLEACKKQISEQYYLLITNHISQQKYDKATQLQLEFLEKYNFDERIVRLTIPATDTKVENSDKNFRDNKHSMFNIFLYIILPVTFIGLIIYFILRNNSTNNLFPVVENQKVENSDTKDYEQRINSIIEKLSSKYGNEVSIENNYSELSKYCSFWIKDEYGSNRFLLIYNLENDKYKRYDIQNISTVNGGEIYIKNCGTSITPNNRILIEGDNGANSIGYTKYILEINPSNWQIKEICSGVDIIKNDNGYIVTKMIMSKWKTCNADSEYISIEVMYDFYGNPILPTNFKKVYRLSGLIDEKYPITMELAIANNQLYGKYYYDNTGDSNNYLYLYGGVSSSKDIIILEYNNKGDQTSKFSGRLVNGSFCGIFTNHKNIEMPFGLSVLDMSLPDAKTSNDSYMTYYNSRFDFTVKYPSILNNLTKSENGDGCIFSKDSNTFLKVYGMHNVLNRTIEEEFNKYKSQSPVYSLKKNNWFVISDYTKDGHIFYLKTVLRSDVFITAYLQYPSEQKELYSPMINEIFSNFPN